MRFVHRVFCILEERCERLNLEQDLLDLHHFHIFGPRLFQLRACTSTGSIVGQRSHASHDGCVRSVKDTSRQNYFVTSIKPKFYFASYSFII